MTDRAAVITKIREVIATRTDAEDIPPTALLSLHVDSLEVVEIAIALEDELGLPVRSLEPADDWTIDKVADAAMAAKETART